LKFDLVSDLHIDFWNSNEQLKWEGIGTSLLAVVLGDISRNLNDTYRTIVDISKHYKHVIFIDGNHEHNNECGFQEHNKQLKSQLDKYQNISYLNRRAIVLDGVAFIGANGWWTFDFMEPEISKEEAYWYFLSKGIYSEPYMHEVFQTAMDDAHILKEIVAKLTMDSTVSEIVMLTHTSPLNKFNDTLQVQDLVQYSRCGSSFLAKVLDFDINNKIKTWCFGHVHQDFDETINGVRYICHPRGRRDDSINNLFYYPKLIDS
jgi:UDP-2,3-diacylglucosamine pyrophosphatase LpxH